MLRTYFVYIIECKDGTYYTGITNDIDSRFEQHKQGLNPSSFTAKRRPLKLVWTEEFRYVNDAISWEKQIKKWSKAKKRALINGDMTALIEAAKKRFDG